MRTAAPSFREPPDAPMDAMWARIEREHFGSSRRDNPWRHWYGPIIGMAATLVIGFGLGRSTSPVPRAAPRAAAVTVDAGAGESSSDIVGPYRAVTSRYLGQAVTLLVALPSSSDYTPDRKLIERAGDLLSTTRLLLDSPAAEDPELKVLLDDLEFVLAQVVRLSSNRPRQELELITDALVERDVLPRLQNAVTSFPLSATN
jgi:hypothetical protein